MYIKKVIKAAVDFSSNKLTKFRVTYYHKDDTILFVTIWIRFCKNVRNPIFLYGILNIYISLNIDHIGLN